VWADGGRIRTEGSFRHSRPTCSTATMGGGGEKQSGPGSHSRINSCFRLEEQPDGAIGMRLRSSSLAPEQGKPQHRRTSSYDRLHELADWRRCGVHSEYADAALVGSPGEIPIHHLRPFVTVIDSSTGGRRAQRTTGTVRLRR